MGTSGKKIRASGVKMRWNSWNSCVWSLQFKHILMKWSEIVVYYHQNSPKVSKFSPASGHFVTKCPAFSDQIPHLASINCYVLPPRSGGELSKVVGRILISANRPDPTDTTRSYNNFKWPILSHLFGEILLFFTPKHQTIHGSSTNFNRVTPSLQNGSIFCHQSTQISDKHCRFAAVPRRNRTV